MESRDAAAMPGELGWRRSERCGGLDSLASGGVQDETVRAEAEAEDAGPPLLGAQILSMKPLHVVSLGLLTV